MRNTKFIVAMAMLGCVGLVVWGCGKAPKAPLDDTIAQNSAVEASDAVSPDDLAEMSGGTGGISPLSLSPEGLEPLGPQPPGSILALLNPNYIKARPNLLRAVRAPLDILMYELSKGCYTSSGPCPSLVDRNRSCTIAVDFTASACDTITVTVAGTQHALYFSGTLSGTIEGNVSPYSLPKVTANPSGFTITADDGRWITYNNGSVSRQLTGLFGTPVTGASWILKAENLVAVDSAGAQGTANGTRTVEVEFGKYFHAKNVGTLTFTPPQSTKVITIDLDIERTITTDKATLTKTIVINDVVTTNGVKRTLSGQVTLTGDMQGSQLGSVTINGSITRSGPRGSITVTFKDVVIDLSCNKKPWGGVIEITNGEKTYKIDFGGNCGCIVDITKPDNSTVQYNICTHEAVGND